MDRETILKIFYEEFIPLTHRDGVIRIDGFDYTLNVNYQIEGKEYITYDDGPCLMIHDMETFNDLLVSYVIKFHQILKSTLDIICGKLESNQIKCIFTTLFYNAREEDFKNPISYLKMRIQFIENNPLFLDYHEFQAIAKIDDKEIEVSSYLQMPSFETLYAFRSRIKYLENGEVKYYYLPDISYGICDHVVYIYTIQRKNKYILKEQDKKINRFLYQVNKNVVDSDEYYTYRKCQELGIESFYPENITDVTHNSILALSLFLGILRKENITDITVVDYLPLRYLTKQKDCKQKQEALKKLYSEQAIKEKYISEIFELDRNQFNITNKFIRTFQRVNYHLGNMNIISYPGEIDNSMHIKLNKCKKESDNIINMVYNMIAFAEEKRK